MGRTTVLLALVLCLPGVARADVRVHVVAAGDTLGELAERYRVEVGELREWNSLDGDTIRVGQELVVREEPTIRHRVVPGDTLRCIAARYHVSSRRLREDNPRARRRLEVGTTLRVRGGRDRRADDGEGETVPEPRHHRVTAGENLGRIARRYDVSTEDLLGWNDGLDADRIRTGQRLVVGRTRRRSESIGAAYCGHIVGAERLGRHPAFVLRNPGRSWATRRTVRRLRAGFDAFRRRHRRGSRVRVHDLSLEGGGAIDDHRSHQSGRDVDITYFQRRGCGGSGCPLRRVDPNTLDVRRQWALLRYWLERDDAEAIYVDYALQEPLLREARRRGATEAQLREWFQYPRGRHHGEGVIRHFPNHRDHLHVRFACAPGERRCR